MILQISWYFLSIVWVVNAAGSYFSPTQFTALYDLYNSTNGPNWNYIQPYSKVNGYPWNFTSSTNNPCDSSKPWQGITCSSCSQSECFISQLTLDEMSLSGTIPSSIANLSTLQKFSMIQNEQLSGSIPPSIGVLTKLTYFALGVNAMTGTIPIELSYCTKLTTLYLYQTQITGTLPSELGQLSQLQLFSLHSNAIFGTIPSSYGQLTNIQQLVLFSNNLTSTLPSELGNLVQLQTFDLHYNQLTGMIPSSFAKLTALQYFNVKGNNFTGTLPAELGNATTMETVYFSNNAFTGSIPSAWLQWTKNIISIYLENNQLNGSLPINMDQWSKLQYFYVYNNRLSGSLPTSLGNLNHLTELLLQYNAFTGSLPSSMGDLTRLTTLFLNYNQFTGSLPSTIGNLNQLTNLFAFNNQLNGSLPETIGSMTSLLMIELQNNLFSGTIPESIGLITHLTAIFLFSNQLTGPLPTNITQLTRLAYLNLEDNFLTGNIPTDINNMNRLELLLFSNNLFSGELPITLCQCNRLEFLLLDHNVFMDSIPSCLSNITLLQVLELNNNILTGSFPSDITTLITLNLINVQHNLLTEGLMVSPIPTALRYLAMNHNYFTGTITSTIITTKYALTYFAMNNNLFTGLLPDFISTNTTNTATNNFSLVEYYDCSTNILSGTIPSSYALSFPRLFYFSIANNQLSGSLPSQLGSNQSLNYLYFFQNQLTGSLPDNLFAHSNLYAMVGSMNCLTSKLPTSVCQNTNLSQLIIDGGHSSSACIKSIFAWDHNENSYVPIHRQGIHGTIPTCLWYLPSLKLLHLSGNSLHGTLPSDASENSLISLVLANNYFSGSIPSLTSSSPPSSSLIASTPSNETNQLFYVDLSFNRFSYSLQSTILSSSPLYNISWDWIGNNTPGLFLQVNRLSGIIPSTLTSLQQINILEGNLFSCPSNSISQLPSHDPNVHSYQCGSETTNTSLIIVIVVLFCWFLASLYVLGGLKRWWYELHEIYSHYTRYQLYSIDNLQNSEFIDMKQLYHLMQQFKTMLLYIGIVLLVVCIPIYLGLSLSNQHITYLHQYVWNVSSAFLSDLTSTMLLFVMFVIILSIIIIILQSYLNISIDRNQFFSFFSFSSFTSNSSSYSSSYSSFLLQSSLFFGFICINFFFVLLANILYVRAIEHGYNSTILFFCSIALSLFKLGWGHLYLLTIPRISIVSRMISIPIMLIVMLSMINNVLIPYLAEAFVSSNCFYYTLTPPPSVTSYYLDVTCNIITTCTSSGCSFHIQCPENLDTLSTYVTSKSFSFSPPFHYQYTCSSSLLTSFAYVYVYRFFFVSILLPIVRWVCLYLRSLWLMHATDWFGSYEPLVVSYQRITGFLPSWLQGINLHHELIWKSYHELIIGTWRQMILSMDGSTGQSQGSGWGDHMLVNWTTHLSILFSFGILFPPLGMLIICAMLVEFVTIKYTLGQAWFQIQDEITSFELKELIKQWLQSLNKQCIVIHTNINISLWFTICLSCLFWSFTLFDTLGDKSGALNALWIVMITIAMPLWLWGLIRLFSPMLNFKIFEWLSAIVVVQRRRSQDMMKPEASSSVLMELKQLPSASSVVPVGVEVELQEVITVSNPIFSETMNSKEQIC